MHLELFQIFQILPKQEWQGIFPPFYGNVVVIDNK